MAGRSTKVRATAQAAVALALAFGSWLAAAETADPVAVIEARKNGFKNVLGPAMRTINNELRSEAPSLAALAEPAAMIVAQAPEIAGWFPAGSDASAGVATKALPAVWTDRTEFDELAAQLVVDAKALVAAIEGGDLDTVRAQARTVGANCAACHRKYRD
jgi:cytochrome c556